MNFALILSALLMIVAPVSIWGLQTDFSPRGVVFEIGLYISIATSTALAAYISKQLFWGAWVPKDMRPVRKRLAIAVSVPALLCGMLYGFLCYGVPALYTVAVGDEVTVTANAIAIYRGYSRGGCRYILRSKIEDDLSGDSLCSSEEEYRKAAGGAVYEFEGKSSTLGFYIEGRRLLYAANHSLKADGADAPPP